MTEPSPPRWRVTFRRAGDPMTKHQTLIVAGPLSMVPALKEAQMMLAEKEGGPWLVQAIEEVVDAAPAANTERLGDALDRARHPFP